MNESMSDNEPKRTLVDLRRQLKELKNKTIGRRSTLIKRLRENKANVLNEHIVEPPPKRRRLVDRGLNDDPLSVRSRRY